MNDLTRWRAARATVRPGDLFFFDGSDDSDLVELAQHVLSNGIEVFTHSNWSHVAMALDADRMIESTIHNGVSGPQINPTDERLAGYDGASAYLFRLTDAAREALNIPAALAWAQSRVGVDKYSVASIGHFVLRVFGLGHLVPALTRSIPGEEVCSEYITMAYQRAGIERVIRRALNAHECSPETVARWGVWQTPVQLLGR